MFCIFLKNTFILHALFLNIYLDASDIETKGKICWKELIQQTELCVCSVPSHSNVRFEPVSAEE